MAVVNPPRAGQVRRWVIRLAVVGLLVLTAPVWSQVLLFLAIAGLDELGQRTTVTAAPPGTMPLVAPGREASIISTGGPCYMCASGTRGDTGWGSSKATRILLYMLDREALALLPRSEVPRRVQLVALEPMVVLVRDDPSEVAPEEGFPSDDGYLRIHGGAARLWHGTTLPGPMEGLSWAREGVPPIPVVPGPDGRAVIPIPDGRLVLAAAGGTIIVTRE